jgi:hypothetical protein
MAQMHVTSESPTKIVLEMDPAWKAETSKTYAQSVRQGRGCLGYIALAFVLILGVVGFSLFTNSIALLPWYFWAFAVVALIGGGIFAFIHLSFESSHKDEAGEVVVTFDLDSQQATRVEKSNSGKIKQTEIKLEQVTKVLLHGDDLGHRLTVTLESQNNQPFNVNFDVFFDSKPMIELGKKIGEFIKKPVVFKITDAGKPVSEETIHP